MECYCGNLGYDRYGVGDGCNNPCTGNSTQICGGGLRNSVYLIRKYNKTIKKSFSCFQFAEPEYECAILKVNLLFWKEERFATFS